MNKTQYTWVHCSGCGRKVGRKKGISVVLDFICDDPICHFQEPPTINEQRDSLIVTGVLEGIPVTQIAAQSGISRQRVYQIIDTWKEGI